MEHHGGLAKAVIHKVVSEAPTVEVDALRSAIQEVISVKEHDIGCFGNFAGVNGS